MSAAITVPVLEQLTDEQWAARRRYAYISAEEAAADPRTPESHFFTAGFRSIEQLLYLLERSPLSDRLAYWLLSLLQRDTPTVAASPRRNEVICAALQLPQVDKTHLLQFVNLVNTFSEDTDSTLVGIVRHAQADEQVAASVLVRTRRTGNGEGTATEQAVGLSGFLSATALRLLRLENRVPLYVPSQACSHVLTAVSKLEQLTRDRPELRQVVAVLGPTWNGNRVDLLEVAADLSQQRCLAAS